MWIHIPPAVTGAAGANSYVYVTSDSNPRLLDLMGKTVSAYVWAYPETADDPTIQIYTLQASGSTQTLSSITTAASAQWTLLQLKDQVLNDDLVRVQIRFKVASSTKYTYFDDAVVFGYGLKEYPLPSELQDSVVSKVRIQDRGYSDVACYDLQPRYWGAPEGYDIVQEGDFSSSAVPPVYKRLKFHDTPSSYKRIRITGMAPIPTLASDSATIYLDGERLNLIVAKAAANLYKMEQSPVSSQDKGRYYNEIALWENEYRKLLHLGMIRPSSIINTGV